MTITPHPMKGNISQYLKAMAKIHGQDVLPDVSMPRKPRADKGQRRAAYKQPERKLRNAVIKELRQQGIKVMRVENAVTGRHNTGLPDLWVMNLDIKKAGWIELKAEKGFLATHQEQFREDCLRCGINHWIVRSVADAVQAVL